jgi:hypothetical protein
MSAYQFTPVDAPSRPDVMDAALRLLSTLGDPKQARINLEKHASNARTAAQLDEREAEVARREQSLQSRLDSESDDMQRARSEHDRRLASDRKAFDEDTAQRLRDLESREAKVLAADKRYLELNAALEARLAAIRKAAG